VVQRRAVSLAEMLVDRGLGSVESLYEAITEYMQVFFITRQVQFFENMASPSHSDGARVAWTPQSPKLPDRAPSDVCAGAGRAETASNAMTSIAASFIGVPRSGSLQPARTEQIRTAVRWQYG
jgi:hypothetical protein